MGRKVQRSVHVPERKADGQEIEEHLKSAANAVVAFAARTLAASNRCREDRRFVQT